MFTIQKIDHIGLRVRDKKRSIAFYTQLGFHVASEGHFEKGHPIVMKHPSSIVLNLLGPASEPDGPNVLMDTDTKYAGYTHMALCVHSIDEAKSFFEQNHIEVTDSFEYKNMRAIFVRDPDNNVIEFDEYVTA